MTSPLLLADVGGTFTRLALAEGGAIGPSQVVEGAGYPGFVEAARAFLKGAGARPRRAAIAAAGPLAHGVITLTNGPQWRLAPGEIAAGLDLDGVRLLNDFAALAAAAPHLPPAGLAPVAAGAADPDGAIAVIGPGTGLGVALLAPRGQGRYQVLPGEGGHAGLSPVTPREMAVLAALIKRFDHVKAEHVLSGTGLEILWETLAALDGATGARTRTAAEIADEAASASEPRSIEAIALFTAWLGGFCGDIALIAGATGGVYLAGGVLPRWGDLFDTALFHARFIAKGAHRPIMEAIPIQLVTDKQAAFRGLVALEEQAA